MARGTSFGSIHSHQHLSLIQQSVDVQPAEPKTNYIDIPGVDGSKDFSELPAGRVVFKDRKITWTFALYPGDDWHLRHRNVSNLLNGLACKITLDDDPLYYYEGRLTVTKYKYTKALRQIVVEAVCRPYKLRQEDTRETATLTEEYQTLYLANERMPVVPTIKLSVPATLRYKGAAISLNAGTFQLEQFALSAGLNHLEVKADSGTGSIAVTYREGAL